MLAYGDTMLWLALVLLVLAGGLLGALALATRETQARPTRRPSAG